MKKYFFISITLLLTSCTTNRVDTSFIEKSLGGPLQIDVFAARGFLGGSNFERYHLVENVVWRECGDINSKSKKKEITLKGDSLFKNDPQLETQERIVDNLNKEKLVTIQNSVLKLMETLKADPSTLPPPGSVFSLSDPGIIEVEITVGKNVKHLITSVDAVSDSETSKLKAMNNLITNLRSIGKEICHQDTFFGIGKR
ncbi:MAG: hypothetical protein KBC84_04175 [Proteobacteria bacterium]|nr:hypothetical protein [Pseudomonadota bacterium]